jgi:hypothetical protein
MRSVTENLRIAMDCFTGETASFLPVKFMLEDMEKRALEGDNDASKILEIANNFASLILTADRLYNT